MKSFKHQKMNISELSCAENKILMENRNWNMGNLKKYLERLSFIYDFRIHQITSKS